MNSRQLRGRTRRGTPLRWGALAALAIVSWAGSARAQVTGSGGTTGAVALADADVFIGVQKVMGVNLSDADKAKFLNHASCQCQRDVWIKAIVNASAAAKAQTLPGTDTVTLMIGQACNNSIYYGSCLTLQTLPLSEFRLNGMEVHTTVDVLAKGYGSISNTGTTVVTGTGGSTGSGGDTGVTGSGGSPATEITTATDPCAVGDAYGQTAWIFVESTPTLYDGGTAQQSIVIDGTPPPAPAPVTVTPADGALIVNWTSVNNNNSVPDLQGYQVFCTRADQYQVFKDGTFSTSVDSCNNGLTDLDPTALMDINTHFLCSDFLSTSTSSHRVQILEDGINYGIAVASVDAHGNATVAFPTPPYTEPIPTLDFYHQYREGDPQGAATGGCSIGEGTSSGGSPASLAAFAAAAITMAAARRRRR